MEHTICLNKKFSLFTFVIIFLTVNQFESYLAKLNMIRIAKKIWNKLSDGNFDIYSLCVASLHRKMTPIFLPIP